MDKYINAISEKSNGYDGECILLVILKIDLKLTELDYSAYTGENHGKFKENNKAYRVYPK